MMTRFRRQAGWLALIVVFSTLFSACEKEAVPGPVSQARTYDSEAVQQWIDLVLIVAKETTGAQPPVVARANAYIGLALYEALLPGMPDHQSMQGQVNDLEPGSIPALEAGDYHWGIVANALLADMVGSCYSNAPADRKPEMEALEEQLHQQYLNEGVAADVAERSVRRGRDVALAMIEYANSDGQANCFNTNFPTSPYPSGTGLWLPTPPFFMFPLQPSWGDVRPFYSPNVSEQQPPPHHPFSTEPGTPFYEEMMEVYNTVQNLSPEQERIARFWSDDPGKSYTPPGHSLAILNIVLRQENADLEVAAEAFAQLGMAVHDAFISCWYTKYRYNLIRPITVIHQQVDLGFSIPLLTPPFPEYTSGHSVNSGAAAAVLTLLFGENYAYTDDSQEYRLDIDGSARSYNSFYEFANEAAISRLYGGIHYRQAIDEGVAQGLGIGENIHSRLNWRK